VLALVLAAQCAHGNGSDLPTQIVLRGFLKPEDGHVGHLGWHWMMDAGHRMEHAAAAVSIATMAAVSWWVLLGLLVGGAAWFFPKRFGGAPIPPLWSNAGGGDDHGADRVAGRG
jgi:hypothetical protein